MVAFLNGGAGFSNSGFCVVERGFRIGNGIVSLTDEIKVARIIGGLELIIRCPERLFVCDDRIFLQFQLFPKHSKLHGQARHRSIHVLDARSSQPEFALGETHVLAQHGDFLLTVRNGIPG